MNRSRSGSTIGALERVNKLYQAFCPRFEWQRNVVTCASFKWQQWYVHLVCNGYIIHLHEKLAVFKTKDFDAQTSVQSRCQSMSKHVLRFIITYAIL